MAEQNIRVGLDKTVSFLKLTDKRLRRAGTSVVSQLSRNLPLEAQRKISTIYVISKNRVIAGMRVNRSTNSVELIGSSKGISLVNFGARYGGRRDPGASVTVTVEGGRKVLKQSFIPKKSKIRQIFVRKKLSSGRRARRFPIVKLWGPAVSQMLKRETVVAYLQETAQGYMLESTYKIVGL